MGPVPTKMVWNYGTIPVPLHNLTKKHDTTRVLLFDRYFFLWLSFFSIVLYGPLTWVFPVWGSVVFSETWPFLLVFTTLSFPLLGGPLLCVPRVCTENPSEMTSGNGSHTTSPREEGRVFGSDPVGEVFPRTLDPTMIIVQCILRRITRNIHRYEVN